MPVPEYLEQAVSHGIIGTDDVDNLCKAYHQLEANATEALHPELAISEAFELLHLPERTAIRALISLARKLAPRLGRKIDIVDITQGGWADKTTEYWLGRVFAVLPDPWTLHALAVVAYAELADTEVRNTFLCAIGADSDILPRWMSNARQLYTLGDWLHRKEPEFHRMLQTSLAARLSWALICRPLVAFYTALGNIWNCRYLRGSTSAPTASAQARHELALTAQHLCVVISTSIKSTINEIDDSLIRHQGNHEWRQLGVSYATAVYWMSDLLTSLRTLSRSELSLTQSAFDKQLVSKIIIMQIDHIVGQVDSKGITNPFPSIPALLAHIGRLDAQPVVYAPEQLQEITIALGRVDKRWDHKDTFPAGAWWQQENEVSTIPGTATGGPSQIQHNETEEMEVDEWVDQFGQEHEQEQRHEAERVDATRKRKWTDISRDLVSRSQSLQSDGTVYPPPPDLDPTPKLVLNEASQNTALHNSSSHALTNSPAKEQSASLANGPLHSNSDEDGTAQRTAPAASSLINNRTRGMETLHASSELQDTALSASRIDSVLAAHKYVGINALLAAAAVTVSDLRSTTKSSNHHNEPARVNNNPRIGNEGSAAASPGPSTNPVHAPVVKKLSKPNAASPATDQEPVNINHSSNPGGSNSPILISSTPPTEPSTSSSERSSPIIATSSTDPVFTIGPNLPTTTIDPPRVTSPTNTTSLFKPAPSTPSIVINPPAAGSPPITVHPSPSAKGPRIGTFPVEGTTPAVWPQYHCLEKADDSVEVRYTIAGSGRMERQTFPHSRGYLGWRRRQVKTVNAQEIRVERW